MYVERRKRLAARMAGGDPVEPTEQGFKFALHFKQDLCAGARQERRVAGELDGVAQSLFGVQQNRLVAERKFAEPERTPVAAPDIGHAAAFPAPFILFETAPQLAQR